MSQLFNRDFTLVVTEDNGHALRIAARPIDAPENTRPTLRVQFKIAKNLNEAPNSAEVTIYNLSKDSRSKIQKKNAQMTIEAGYIGATGKIFEGQMTISNHTKTGPDWVTKFEVGDGIQATQSTRVSVQGKAGSKPKDLILSVMKTMGLGEGNSIKALALSTFRGHSEYKKGFALQGKGSDVLSQLIGSAGLEFSIQDGHAQILEPGAANEDTVVQLDPAHGLIGNAEEGEDKKLGKSSVKARSLIQPGLYPGRPVVLKSRDVTGNFRIESVTHTGDTFGQDWYSDLEMTAI